MVSVRVDGTMVLVAAALLGGYYLYTQREKFIAAINPADRDNVVNQTFVGAVGEDNVADVADYLFGAVDLLNPFAPEYRRNYAKSVYGLSQVTP